MIIYDDVYYKIVSQIKPAPPESGGILGKLNGIVTEFVFDEGLVKAPCCYVPDVDKLNRIIENWDDEIEFCGIIHSHASCQSELSEGDKEYIVKILQCMPVGYKSLYFPLLVERKIIPFKVSFVDNRMVIRREAVQLIKRSK